MSSEGLPDGANTQMHRDFTIAATAVANLYRSSQRTASLMYVRGIAEGQKRAADRIRHLVTSVGSDLSREMLFACLDELSQAAHEAHNSEAAASSSSSASVGPSSSSSSSHLPTPVRQHSISSSSSVSGPSAPPSLPSASSPAPSSPATSFYSSIPSQISNMHIQGSASPSPIHQEEALAASSSASHSHPHHHSQPQPQPQQHSAPIPFTFGMPSSSASSSSSSFAPIGLPSDMPSPFSMHMPSIPQSSASHSFSFSALPPSAAASSSAAAAVSSPFSSRSKRATDVMMDGSSPAALSSLGYTFAPEKRNRQNENMSG